MPRSIDEITGAIVDCAVKLHMRLGPGLLESVYQTVMARDLERRGFRVARERAVSFEFEGLQFDRAFLVDLLVVLTHLRLLDKPVGLLINFGQQTLKEGLHRIVNHYHPASGSLLRVNQPLDLPSL